MKHNILKKTLSRPICLYLDLAAVFWFMGTHVYAALTSVPSIHIDTGYAFLLHSWSESAEENNFRHIIGRAGKQTTGNGACHAHRPTAIHVNPAFSFHIHLSDFLEKIFSSFMVWNYLSDNVFVHGLKAIPSTLPRCLVLGLMDIYKIELVENRKKQKVVRKC